MCVYVRVRERGVYCLTLAHLHARAAGPSNTAAHVDKKASAAGFVTIAPSAACLWGVPGLPDPACSWDDTFTPLDPAFSTEAGTAFRDEARTIADALVCVRDTLRVLVSRDVYALCFGKFTTST